MAGLGDKIAGKAKEIQGAATGDEERELEGKVQGTRGTIKDKAHVAKGKVGNALRDAGDKLKK